MGTRPGEAYSHVQEKCRSMIPFFIFQFSRYVTFWFEKAFFRPGRPDFLKIDPPFFLPWRSFRQTVEGVVWAPQCDISVGHDYPEFYTVFLKDAKGSWGCHTGNETMALGAMLAAKSARIGCADGAKNRPPKSSTRLEQRIWLAELRRQWRKELLETESSENLAFPFGKPRNCSIESSRRRFALRET